MRVKNSFLFQFSQCIRPMVIFYSCILTIHSIAFISIYFSEHTAPDVISIVGWDFAGLILLFILGYATTFEVFPFHLQNSVSRRSYFIGRILSMLVVSAITTIIYSCVLKIFFENIFVSWNMSFKTESFLHLLYFETDIPTVTSTIWSNVILFILSLFVTMLGVLFSGIFYRAEMVTKIIIAAGIMLFFLIILPLANIIFFAGTLYSIMFEFMGNVLGIFEHAVWKGCLSFGVLFIVTTLLSWLVYRRMPMKR